MKQTFVVSISRSYIHKAVLNIEAESAAEAEAKALEQIGDTIMVIDSIIEDSDYAEILRIKD